MAIADQPPGNPSDRPLPRPLRLFLGPDGRVRPLLRAVSFGVTLFFISMLVSGGVGALMPQASLWQIFFWGSNALLASGLLLSWFFLRVGDGRPFCQLGLCPAPGWFEQALVGVALGLVLQAAMVAMLFATGSLHYTTGTLHGAHSWLKLLGDVWLLAAAATYEEIAFRGYALQMLMKSVGTPVAMALTSVVFGLAHWANPAHSGISIVNTMLAGLMLAIPYVRTRSMWTQCSLHWAWNFFMGPIFSLPVSGILFTPNVFSSQLSRARWSGGYYGPEGGLVSTLVLLAASAWLWGTRRLEPGGTHRPSSLGGI
jgi:uncharacterized protein